ncbi:hypothetical protein QFC22_006480 [Naganishia vaughanmartiniae]|uniref:Uncharacterized protein n=1 Tax=Naganishia vaughanmartiniae TaxID=1424756 RepID=A0ACC2WIU0_9TREE|nr:hypothetical protein QFC22_006480 [Naganishia vaughanmartiniae]
MTLLLFFAVLTGFFTATTTAQTVPVSIINQCNIPVQPQFLGTNNGLANPPPLVPGQGASVTVDFNQGFAGFIAASTGEQSSVYGNASLIYVNLNTGNYWLVRPASPPRRHATSLNHFLVPWSV